MKIALKRVLNGLILTSFFLNCSSIQANLFLPSYYSWMGANGSDITDSSNWQPGIVQHPAAGDVGIFDSSIPPLSFTPMLSSTTSSNTFAIDLIQFNSPSSPFVFNIKDPNTAFTFAGTAPASVYGVQNNSGINEIFNISSSAEIIFQNKCSADSSTGTSPGMMIYNIGDAATPGTITFQGDSDAGSAFYLLKSGSSLNFQNNSSAAQAIINTNDDDTVNFAQDGNGVVEASLIGTGTVNKTGKAALEFSTNNALFNGTTKVKAGNLILNNILGGDIHVYSNALLSGNGIAGKNLQLHSGGSVKPGNSIGTMSVNGTFTQAANSKYIVQVDGSGNASKLNVSGQTILNYGALLGLEPLIVQLAPNTSHNATILTSETGVSGTYADVVTSNPLIAQNVSYDAKNVYLTWTNALSLIAETSNQQSVTDQLQTIQEPSPWLYSTLATLVQLPHNEQQHALNQLTAQPYANLLLTAELSDHKFIKRLYNPIRIIITTLPYCAEGYDPCGCLISTWFDSGWNHSNFKGSRKAKGFHLSGFEVSLGVQATVNDCWTFGLAGTYENEYLKYKVGGTGKAHTFLGGLYTLYRPADFYVLGDVVLGCTKQKIKRHIDIGTYHFKNHNKPEIFQGSLYVEAGKDYALDCLLIQPFMGIEAGYFRHGSIHERGSDSAFGLNVKNKSLGTASSRLGLHMLTEMSCFKLYCDAAWQYRLTSLRNHSRQAFQTFGTDFEVAGIPLARSSFDGAVNLSLTVIDGCELYAQAEGQWWHKAASYSLLGGLQIFW